MTKFSDHVAVLDGIFKNYRTTAAKIAEGLAKAEETYKASQRNGALSEHRRAAMKEDWADAQRVARQDRATAAEQAKAAIAKARRDLEDDVSAFLKVDPSKVDGNTVALLQSGAMTDDDLVTLASANASNVTMLKMIGAEAGRRTDSRQATALGVKIGNFLDASTRLAAFDKAAYVVKQTLNPIYAETLGNYWDTEYRSSVVADLDALNTFSGE
jgi:hypothetical protein